MTHEITDLTILRETLRQTLDGLEGVLDRDVHGGIVITITIKPNYAAHLRKSLNDFAIDVIQPALAKAEISKP